MERMIIVLHVFSWFFSRASAGFFFAQVSTRLQVPPGLRSNPLFPVPWVPRSRGSHSKDASLSLEGRTEEGKEMTTEKWPLGRAEGSTELSRVGWLRNLTGEMLTLKPQASAMVRMAGFAKSNKD